MTIENQQRRVVYAADGVSLNYTVPFPFLYPKWLTVSVGTGEIGSTDTTLRYDIDYTVTGAGSPTGGKVILTAPQPVGKRIAISRWVPLTQLEDYPEGGKFPAETTEYAFDKLTMIAQQLQDIANGNSFLPPSSTKSAVYVAQWMQDRVDEAEASAEAAKASENNAATSAAAAATSATKSAQSATQSAQSATQSAQSATQSAVNAEQAKAEADRAEEAATAAQYMAAGAQDALKQCQQLLSIVPKPTAEDAGKVIAVRLINGVPHYVLVAQTGGGWGGGGYAEYSIPTTTADGKVVVRLADIGHPEMPSLFNPVVNLMSIAPHYFCITSRSTKEFTIQIYNADGTPGVEFAEFLKLGTFRLGSGARLGQKGKGTVKLAVSIPMPAA